MIHPVAILMVLEPYLVKHMKKNTIHPPQLLVIGLDGATFEIIEPLAKAGHLPNLNSLMNQGIWERLKSTIPPVSPQAWSSFLTGVNPGKHGIFGFQGPAIKRMNQRTISNYTSIQSPTILKLISDAGLKTVVLGMPMTYPPVPVNGYNIPEQHGPPKSHPPGLWNEVCSTIGDIRDPSSHIAYLFTREKQGYIDFQIALADKQYRAFRFMLSRCRADLAMMVFTQTDRMSHYLWHTVPDDRTDTSNPIAKIYCAIDGLLGELIHDCGEKTSIIVMSDHGFTNLQQICFLNSYLEEKGFLKKRSFIQSFASRRYPWLVYRSYNAIARRFNLPHIGIPFDRLKRPIDPDLYDPRLFIDPHVFIDWRSTEAYMSSMADHGIFLNVKGREPEGIIHPGNDYERIRQNVRDSLCSMTLPGSNSPMFRNVWMREDLYHGNAISTAPDIIFETNNDTYMCLPHTYHDDLLIDSHIMTGMHQQDGILIMAGESFIHETMLHQPRIIDLAPTLLNILDLPVPEYMDGRVLVEALRTPPVKGVETNVYKEAHPLPQNETVELDEEDRKKLEDHLRGLGYI